MTFRAIYVAPCLRCRRDVAKISQGANGGFDVVCDPAAQGCGRRGGYEGSEALAVEAWNLSNDRSQSAGAQALVEAATRRAGGAR